MSTRTISSASGNRPPGIWIETPRQPKQNRCRQCSKRTFFWIIEPDGVICKTCLNVRETAKAFPPRQPSASGQSINGKTRKSTKAPVIKNAILARRANGMPKSRIAKELHLSHNTVRQVLNETDFDVQIEQGRFDSVRLIPKAMHGLEKSFDKGDGSVCLRFLEGIGVVRENTPHTSKMGSDVHLQQAIQILYQPSLPQSQKANEVESISDSPQEVKVTTQVIDQTP